ncbi:hypothetical protein AB0M23_13560 [Streptomyces sp. NPDC052077]|uniref:hypothetical protein n=1 Tax=Streptomyces sp. NPDC052077 TaxID=3154757 RepID=UPI0034149653
MIPRVRKFGIIAAVVIVVISAFCSTTWEIPSMVEIELITAVISMFSALTGLLVVLAPRSKSQVA